MTERRQIPYKNVLVARFSALGDVAMAIPVVYSVCRAYPQTRFILITQNVASSLFMNAPANLIVRGVDIRGKYKGFSGLKKLCHDLRKEFHIDAFADLHDVIRTQILRIFFRLAGIHVQRIRKGRLSKWLLTHRHGKRLRQLPTSHQRYHDVFRRLGFDFGEQFTGLFVNKLPLPSTFSEITAPKQLGETWIAVAPFAKHPGKIYPPELMRQVVEVLSKRQNTRIFLFGGGDSERRILRQWAEEIPNALSMAEKRHGFPVELPLLSYMDVMLSMDSANMHLASLAGLPAVSIWGATHPFCGFLGWGQKLENCVQRDDLPCRPCSVYGKRPCRYGDYRCLRGISPATIVAHINKVLEEKDKTEKNE